MKHLKLLVTLVFVLSTIASNGQALDQFNGSLLIFGINNNPPTVGTYRVSGQFGDARGNYNGSEVIENANDYLYINSGTQCAPYKIVKVHQSNGLYDVEVIDESNHGFPNGAEAIVTRMTPNRGYPMLPPEGSAPNGNSNTLRACVYDDFVNRVDLFNPPGATSILTDNNNGTFTHNDGDGTEVTIDIRDNDSNPSNEIQSLFLTSNTLSISDGNSVNLSPYLDNTDNQTLLYSAINDQITILNGNTITIQDDVEDDDSDPSNELQTLDFDNVNRLLTLSNGNSVTIPSSNGTDDQNIALNGNTLSIENGNSVSLAAINTDNQTLSLIGNSLLISGGNSVDLTAIDTDNQTLSYDNATGNLTISNGNTIMLPQNSGGDNWGNQVAETGTTINGDGSSANPLEANISTDANNGLAVGTDGGLYAASGGGGGMEIYRSGDALIRASSTGIQFSKFNGTGTVVVPPGVKLYALSVDGETSDLSSNNFIVRVEYDGINYNTSGTDYFSPTIDVINTTSQLGGGPSQSLPYIYDEGSTPQRQITSAANGDIDARVINLNSFSNWTITMRF